jgi:multisubunit Na+/H+ antiporter MnhB subunit
VFGELPPTGESGDVENDSPPFGRLLVCTATAVGVVALALAGLLFYLAIPVEDGDSTRIDHHLDCDGLSLLALAGAIMVGVGFWLLLAGVQRAFQSRSRSSALVAFCGLCLLVWSAAVLLLYSRLDWLCESS